MQALAARPALEAVQITYSEPSVFTFDDTIWFGNAATTSAEPDTMRGGANLPSLEDYQLTLHLQSITLVTDGQEIADTRVAELFSEVQQTMAAVPQIINDVLICELYGWQHATGPGADDGTGYASKFDVQYRVRARVI